MLQAIDRTSQGAQESDNKLIFSLKRNIKLMNTLFARGDVELCVY